MLTISELADFAGVTVRAVRHYHQRGLLPEPERDASGYRRYDADAVVALIRIRVLAGAGVPLSRVRALLAAEPEEFAAAVEQIDADLRAEVRRLRRNREQIARLAGGESLALPPVAVRFLDHLREAGISEPTVRIERDAWILLAARTPDRIEELIAAKDALLDDPDFLSIYAAFDQARNWSPDDPRLHDVARTMLDGLANLMRDAEVAHHAQDSAEAMDGDLVALLDQQSMDSSPAWRRLGELLVEGGHPGWPTDG